MKLLALLSTIVVLALVGCNGSGGLSSDDPNGLDGQAPVQDPDVGGYLREDPAPVAPASRWAPEVVEVEPDYPSCAFAQEGEVCEEFGTIKVKPVEPDYPPCVLAQEGEVCEGPFGKITVKLPEVQPCYAALSGEVCEEFGNIVVKP